MAGRPGPAGAGDAGPGSRPPCWCRIGLGARSSPRAWRASCRSAAAPPTDHAGTPPLAKQQVSAREPSFGHPHPEVDTVLVAVGGGGLLGGICSWYGARTPWLPRTLARPLSSAFAAG